MKKGSGYARLPETHTTLHYLFAVPSAASHGIDIIFYDVTEQEILADYLSVENFVDNFCEVISMVNPDITFLSWRREPPQGERCVLYYK